VARGLATTNDTNQSLHLPGVIGVYSTLKQPAVVSVTRVNTSPPFGPLTTLKYSSLSNAPTVH